MSKSVSPILIIAAIGIVIIIAVVIIWQGSNQSVKLPDKPPSGPIVLPASQQGRIMPSGRTSGPMIQGTPGK